MWFFLAAVVVAAVVSLVLFRMAVQRHRKRQHRSMRDHLNRISRISE
jgi:archaellin